MTQTVTAEMLPFTNIVRWRDGTHPTESASVYPANHEPGIAPFCYVSLDSRDSDRYKEHCKRAAHICALLNDAGVTP